MPVLQNPRIISETSHTYKGPHNLLVSGDHTMKDGIGWIERFLSKVFVLVLLLAFFIQAGTATPVLPFNVDDVNPQDLHDSYRPGVLLVRAADSPAEEIASVLSSAHATIGARVLEDYSAEGAAGLQLIALPDGMSVNDGVAYYSAKSGIQYAEPDYYRTLSVIPDDPDLWRQWGLVNTGQVYKEDKAPGVLGADIHAASAWNTTVNSDVIIAVIDSGVDYLHEDLADNIWTNPQTGTHGYDAITGSLEPMDLASHGTHCAGIIGAVGDNRIGGSGVNWNATILPIRFLNSFGTGSVSDEIEGLLWAARNGAQIFSCSYGGSDFSQAEYEVIAGTEGLFICAAGNSGLDNDFEPHYPSCYDLDNIISVAATDADDYLADFSNFGKISVDVAAPGSEIYSTKHNLYSNEPIWMDSFESFNNWTTHGNWTIDTSYNVTPPSSASGIVNRMEENSTDLIPIILSLKEPLHLEGLQNPMLTYELSMVGANFHYRLEGSSDNLSWKTLDYTTKSFIIMPFLHKECKIPENLLGNDLYIRFVADGQYIYIGLDDVGLTDGYGAVSETRYGYMSGTSMACPFVSGAAALLHSAYPNETFDSIKSVILSTVDKKPSLKGMTFSGGRLNLSNALNYLKYSDINTITVQPGWNYLSVPARLISDNDTAVQVFGQVTNTSGHSVLKFFNNSWEIVQPYEKIEPLFGYWVWTELLQKVPLIVDPNQSGLYSRTLQSGWNNFGILGIDILPAKEQLAPLNNSWNYAISFNASGQKYDEPIIRDISGNQSDIRMMYPKQGYWLYTPDVITYQKVLL